MVISASKLRASRSSGLGGAGNSGSEFSVSSGMRGGGNTCWMFSTAGAGVGSTSIFSVIFRGISVTTSMLSSEPVRLSSLI